MFDLLFRKKDKITSQMLWTIVVADYANYVKEHRNSINEEDRVALTEKLQLLKESGLTSTSNYEAISSQVEDLKRKVEVGEFLQVIKDYYPDSIVMPWTSLLPFLNKYDLEIAPLSTRYYDKLIPNDNLDELINAKRMRINDEEKYCVNRFKHIDELVIEFTKSATKDEKAMIVNLLSRIPFIVDSDGEDSPYPGIVRLTKVLESMNLSRNFYNLNTTISFYLGNRPDRVIKSLSSESVFSRLGSNEWVICAPSSDIKDQSTIKIVNSSHRLKSSPKVDVEDPLVGKLCKYGFIILSKWGREATLEEVLKWK